MKRSWWRFPAALTLLAAPAAGCGDPFDPSTVTLTGRWTATVGGMGIGFVTLDLTETNKQLAGTGTYTRTGSTTQYHLGAHGLHFAGDVQLSLDLDTPTGTETLVLPGTIEGANSFHLLFPTEPPLKVIFNR